MNLQTYKMLEKHMLACMSDSAHDKEHIYRVLYVALDIAGHENDVDYDVLISACLLHDIGRREQFENPQLCHAIVGSEKAYNFLISKGMNPEYAKMVKECIKTHRFRSEFQPQSIEAKILFDSDKVDITGTLGIARTILYNGHISEPLYSLMEDGQVSDGTDDASPSFFREYKYKLEGLYNQFYTKRGTEIAAERQISAITFYNNLLHEVRSSYKFGQDLLLKHIDN